MATAAKVVSHRVPPWYLACRGFARAPSRAERSAWKKRVEIDRYIHTRSTFEPTRPSPIAQVEPALTSYISANNTSAHAEDRSFPRCAQIGCRIPDKHWQATHCSPANLPLVSLSLCSLRGVSKLGVKPPGPAGSPSTSATEPDSWANPFSTALVESALGASPGVAAAVLARQLAAVKRSDSASSGALAESASAASLASLIGVSDTPAPAAPTPPPPPPPRLIDGPQADVLARIDEAARARFGHAGALLADAGFGFTPVLPSRLPAAVVGAAGGGTLRDVLLSAAATPVPASPQGIGVASTSTAAAAVGAAGRSPTDTPNHPARISPQATATAAAQATTAVVSPTAGGIRLTPHGLALVATPEKRLPSGGGGSAGAPTLDSQAGSPAAAPREGGRRSASPVARARGRATPVAPPSAARQRQERPASADVFVPFMPPPRGPVASPQLPLRLGLRLIPYNLRDTSPMLRVCAPSISSPRALC